MFACVIGTYLRVTGFHKRPYFFNIRGMKLSPLGTSATKWRIVPASDDKCGAFDLVKITGRSLASK
jgi:hypothetical protein